MVGFNVNIQRVVVRLSVGIVRSVVDVERDIQEVDDLEVSLDCDVQSVMSFLILSACGPVVSLSTASPSSL